MYLHACRSLSAMMMPAMYFLFSLFTKSLRTGIIRCIPKSISIYQRWGYSEPWNRMINPMKSAGFTVLPSMTGRRTEEQAYGEAFGGLYTPVFVDIQDFSCFATIVLMATSPRQLPVQRIMPMIGSIPMTRATASRGTFNCARRTDRQTY